MKVLVESKDEEGMIALLGKTVTLFCGVYIYTGKLVGVNDQCVKLSEAAIVYDTGPHETKTWLEVKSFPGDWYVATQSIESFGIFK